MQKGQKGKWCFAKPKPPEYQVDKDELRKRLTPVQYRVTQEKATERPFSGQYVKLKDNGFYACIVCGDELFSSETKYDSSCGWPAFYDITDTKKVRLAPDLSHVGGNLLLLAIKPDLVRTEVTCAKCGAHLGHLFDDGPKPTGIRYCINSAALKFRKQEFNDEVISNEYNVANAPESVTIKRTQSVPSCDTQLQPQPQATPATGPLPVNGTDGMSRRFGNCSISDTTPGTCDPPALLPPAAGPPALKSTATKVFSTPTALPPPLKPKPKLAPRPPVRGILKPTFKSNFKFSIRSKAPAEDMLETHL